MKAFTLVKDCLRVPASEKIQAQLANIADSVTQSKDRRSWEVGFVISQIRLGDGITRLVAEFSIELNGSPEDRYDYWFSTVLPTKFGTSGWDFPRDAKPTVVEETVFALPENWEKAFEHIYGRADQINLCVSTVEAAIDSFFENRFNVVLYGPPACGKSTIAEALLGLFPSEAVMKLDGTSTSMAGAIKALDNADILPKLIVVEEIEKTSADSLRWLLGLMDYRAEIRKVTAREKIVKTVKTLVVATVNDYELFSTVLSGALASRFAHHIYCDRPSEELLVRILDREIAKVGGKQEWIPPTIQWARLHKLSDPRGLIAVCLCGKDGLLDGSYQAMLERTRRPVI